MMPQADTKVDLARRLEEVNGFLDRPLNDVLGRFAMDDSMKSALAGYLEYWGPRPLREFAVGVLISGEPSEPDVANGDMEPYNILLALQTLGGAF